MKCLWVKDLNYYSSSLLPVMDPQWMSETEDDTKSYIKPL